MHYRKSNQIFFITLYDKLMCEILAFPSNWFQAGEGESDPLMGVENGSGGVVTDAVAQKAPVWKSNKDLHA